MCDSAKNALLQVGWYVTLYIIDVPASVMESVQSGRPLTLVSLLPHEQKVRLLRRVFFFCLYVPQLIASSFAFVIFRLLPDVSDARAGDEASQQHRAH